MDTAALTSLRNDLQAINNALAVAIAKIDAALTPPVVPPPPSPPVVPPAVPPPPSPPVVPPVVPPPPSPPVVPPSPPPVPTGQDDGLTITATEIVFRGERIPIPANRFDINPGGVFTVDGDLPTRYPAIVVRSGGVLRFRTDVDTRLRLTTLIVMPGGRLEMGTATDPIKPNVKAELLINDIPIDLAADPNQWGNGLIAFGTVEMHGAAKTSWANLGIEPKAGDTSLRFANAVTGWQAGDKLVIPDSRQRHVTEKQPDDVGYVCETERRDVVSVSADGFTVTLSAPLSYDHPGSRDPDGKIEDLPDVGNLSFNAIVRSESATGTRGHCIFLNRADVRIWNAQFRSLGRSTNAPFSAANKKGRYSVHIEHLRGPADAAARGLPQFEFCNSSSWCGMDPNPFRWGIVIHGSHHGTVAGNVVHGWAGGGIVLEDGSETDNDVVFNLVTKIRRVGGGGQPDERGPNDVAHEGVGIWARSYGNFIIGNVCADCYRGYRIWADGAEAVRVPNFPGADTTNPAEYTVRNAMNTPIAYFDNNTAYGGATDVALSFYALGMKHYDQLPGTQPSVVNNFKAWAVRQIVYYNYKTARLTFNGFKARSDPAKITDSAPVCFFAGDYVQNDYTIRNADVQGFWVGFDSTIGDVQRIENSFFRCKLVVRQQHQWWLFQPHERALPPRTLILRGVRFAALPGGSATLIRMNGRAHTRYGSLVVRDEVWVYDHNGQPGQNYRVFHAEQLGNATLAADMFDGPTKIIVGCPVPNLTNALALAQHGVCHSGEIAPAAATAAAWTNGLVKAI